MADVPAGQPAPVADATPPAAPAAPTDGTAPPVEPKAPAEPPKTFSQEQLDEILEKRLGKERRKREELQRRLRVTEELALKGRPKELEPAKPVAKGEPKREDFDSYEAFIEAKAEWKADQRVDAKLAKDREESERTKTQEEQQKLKKQFQEATGKMATEIEDLDEVLSSSEAPMTEAMANAVMSCDPVSLGVKVTYYLAKHPEEAERIAALPAPRQAAEIGKLEAKLSVETPPKKPSQAPEPIKPVGAGAGVQTGLREGMPYKEFKREREKQLGRK